MQMLSVAELESQMALELPDRDLMSLIRVVIKDVHDNLTHFEVVSIENLLNKSFNNWHINTLNNNTLTVTVSGNPVTVTAFCNQVVAVLALQCAQV